MESRPFASGSCLHELEMLLLAGSRAAQKEVAEKWPEDPDTQKSAGCETV
jgi:hypothetical protein